MKTRGGGSANESAEKPAAEKPADDAPAGPTIEHDPDGNVVINIDDEMQGNIGLQVAIPAAAQLSPEFKGYGRVLDPASLTALMTELASAQAAYNASSNELARLNTLAQQGNAPRRALETAEATAMRDQLAVRSAKDRLALIWGQAVADQKDLSAFTESLISHNAALIRIDLPAGDDPKSLPTGARVLTMSGDSAETEFLELASNVDPQTQGRGFIFHLRTNALQLLPGASVTGYVKVPGEPLVGVIVPREAVVRTDGAGWIYVANGSAEAYKRTEIALDHPTEAGWFVAKGPTATNYVVVKGAQTLLSQEMKAALKPD
ncbi:MAG: hypothetical protein JWR69_1845 [Pedosphaera sp.]|nr:hypothetical protein [Pedosphaera sp.]